MSKLEVLTDQQLIPLLNESKHAFLPSKNNPDETAISLVEKFKKDTRYETLGYTVGNKAVSYIVALGGRSDSEIVIGPMYVTEEFRGNGLGKYQVTDFIHVFAERGCTSIYTKTWMGNIAARRSFEALGFSEIGRKDGDRIDGDSTISYALELIES